MKKLYIIRHAEACKGSYLQKDFERSLSTQGQQDAKLMGERLKKRNIAINLMLSSVANRALTTCTIMAGELNYEVKKIKTDKHIYSADRDQLLEVIKQINDCHIATMIFGHNPACTDLANILLGEHFASLPTCGVVATDLDIPSWGNIKPRCGQMVFFDSPR